MGINGFESLDGNKWIESLNGKEEPEKYGARVVRTDKLWCVNGGIMMTEPFAAERSAQRTGAYA